MRCLQAGKYFSPYLDGELGTTDTARLEAHLAHCDRCSGELDELKRLHGLFMRAERFSAPSGFSARVMERADAHPVKGFSFFPIFARFVEAGVFLLVITAGIMSGGMMMNAIAPHQKGRQVVSSLSLETFEAMPPDSMGSAYLAMTEEGR
jgi:anti-sigma factor RsiW